MPRVKNFDETEILEKVMDFFWEKGYHATSMGKLVKDLGVNRASLYDTYGSKGELFTRALTHYMNTNSKRVKVFLSEYDSVKEGLETLLKNSIRAIFADKDRKGCFVVNCTTELTIEDQKTQQMLTQNRVMFEQLFLDYLQKGVESGELDRDKDWRSVASYLFTFYSGLNVISKINTSEEELLGSLDVALSVLD